MSDRQWPPAAQWPPPLDWPSEPLTDGVIVCDRLRMSDVERAVLGCTDPATQRWLPLPSPYGRPDAEAFIRSRGDAAASGEELTFAVRGAGDPTLAGAIGLSQRGRRNEAEIGYWTAPDRRGRGWTARAVRLVATHAMTTLPLRRIEILVAVDNVHSHHVARTAGAHCEGTRRNGLPSGLRGDAVVYSLVPGDLDGTGGYA